MVSGITLFLTHVEFFVPVMLDLLIESYLFTLFDIICHDELQHRFSDTGRFYNLGKNILFFRYFGGFHLLLFQVLTFIFTVKINMCFNLSVMFLKF